MIVLRGTMTVQRRHFLVRETEDGYQLREIDPDIAHGVDQYGTTTGECKRLYAVESIHWTFYFVNARINRRHADEIAEQLTQEFLNGER